MILFRRSFTCQSPFVARRYGRLKGMAGTLLCYKITDFFLNLIYVGRFFYEVVSKTKIPSIHIEGISVALERLELSQTEPESGVLPLHHKAE